MRGVATELCQWCNGRGKTQLDHTCNTCQGNGRKRCEICSGNGVIKCNTCKGRGKLKHFIKLTVTWRNHTDDFVVENTNLPDDLICDVTGEIVFSDQNFRVSPVTCFQPNINKASKQLIQKHSQVFPTELILQQRQKVRIIPVTEATYSWKNKIGGFFVYGFEKKVHFPHYPQACCCGCTIL
ncbi:protein SSUH2 homolog [Centruroides sculpturatus]|uniref:protein SSUH2 homolog n=1 Tax=Centruroides sculpturatus TaxID=218467 RepID=UPI000C6E9975|nr:protein SSUH2 homolog [Centruroides sculpturatus]